MGQVAAVSEIHAHDRIAGRQKCEEHRHIRLRAGVRLYVGISGAENFLRTVDGDLLHHIHAFAAAVVTLARIAFRVLIREDAALRLHHRAAHDIFRGNQLQLVLLP